MFRTQIVRQARLFSTSTTLRKSPVETVKDAAKKVDRAVSDAAVKGIETGESVVGTVKEKMPETEGEVKGKANEAMGEAKGKAQELKGEAKGKASEIKAKTP